MALRRSLEIAIKICTARHKKHGNRMQPAISGREGGRGSGLTSSSN